MAGTYVYVDGESHYIRSRQWLKDARGHDAELTDLREGDSAVKVHPKGHFFWHHDFRVGHGRHTYFTSLSGIQNEVFALKCDIRNAGLDPYVVTEPGKLAKQRVAILEQTAIIEKAKGVDIALAVRMLEDAYLGNYSEAVLYTSDVDYLPVIESVRRMGKVVTVRGYKSGLGDESAFLHVPDHFVDLEHTMRRIFPSRTRQP